MGKGVDYYDALGIARNADDVEIKKAFRRLALQHHPDTDPSEQSAKEFTRICEAYDVLSSAKNKGTYDLYGEDVLKSIEEGGGRYVFDAVSGPQAVFARFFGTSNPYEALNSLSALCEKLTTQAKTPPGKQQEFDLIVPLEELYQGCVKVINHTRRCLAENGVEITSEQRTLTVDIKAGLPDGTRFVFKGEGDSAPGQPSGTVVLVLSSAPHPRFRRQLCDLVAKVQLPLLQALVGGAVKVTTLDGRVLSVPLEEIVTPGLTMRVAGEGLPIPGGGKGDLIVEFELVFPVHLTQQQKMLIKAGLYLPQKPGKEQAKALRELESAFIDNSHGWSTGVLKENGAST